MEFTGEEGGRLLSVMRLTDERCAPTVLTRCIVRSLKETMLLTREVGQPWTQELSFWAVKFDQVDIVKWLIDNGCPWSVWTMEVTGYFNLELVKLLRSRGCPWGEGAVADAITSGHPEVAEWMIKNGCPQ